MPDSRSRPEARIEHGDRLHSPARRLHSSLAGARGLKWDTVWNHPKNAQLKAKRKDPNVLMPGDVVYLPDLDPRIEDRPTDQRHEFVLLGERTTLRIRML